MDGPADGLFAWYFRVPHMRARAQWQPSLFSCSRGRLGVLGAQTVGVVRDVGRVAEACGADADGTLSKLRSSALPDSTGADLRKFLLQTLERHIEKKLVTRGMLERIAI